MLRFVRQLSTPAIRRIAVPLMALAALAVFLVSVGVLFVEDRGRDQPVAAPTTTSTSTVATSSTTTLVPRPGIAGFDSVKMSVTPAGGSPVDYCALLADNDAQRAQGLMRQQNLGGYDAMVFRFPQDVTNAFYMANVSIPLSIAWFNADGGLVSTADMELCNTEANKCPRYKATGAYRYAVEVAKGGLSGLGITAGSTISVGGTCA